MRIMIALGITMVLALSSQIGFDARWPGWLIVAVYLLFYLLLGRFGPYAASAAEEDDKPDPRVETLPTSGPIGRLGQGALVLTFFGSQLLVLLNPWQVSQVLRQLVGNLALERRLRKQGSDGRDWPTEVRYRLPFDGEWLLINGGPTPNTSHSWTVLTQRFALDFVVADDDGARHRGRGTTVEDYFAYGQPILAAAEGEVVSVVDGIGNAPLVGWGVCDVFARHFAGNHIIIRHADQEYGFYAHLIRARITVKPGDIVQRGQVIGYCGHTGHSTEPHLHFHIQDDADFFKGMGRPICFEQGLLDGSAMPDAHLPRAGERLAARQQATA